MSIGTLFMSVDQMLPTLRLSVALKRCQTRKAYPSDLFYGLHIQLEL
jgi:F0F1-type ATP synthase alpha subunit